MRFSRKFKSSSHCLPSPDGRLVATLLPSGIHVQAVDRLDEVANVVALPADLSVAAVVSFQWSPSSQRVLVATSDQILVAAALPSSEYESEQQQQHDGTQLFRAIIRNPSLPVVAKPTFVDFGRTDDRVCLCSAFGIKFAVFDLQTGKTVEVSNPKLFSSASVCRRGFAFRPASNHLALLTRTAGKDWVSVHDPASSAPVASWAPDTIDAQGLVWSPDGRWLAVWESPAHGHKILFYTPDGHPFKTWAGGPSADGRQANDDEGGRVALDAPGPHVEASFADELLGSGVRLVQFSADARTLAVGDASRSIRIIDMSSITASIRLVHPAALAPHASTSFTIWQEQIDLSTTADACHSFIEASQNVSPPGRPAATGADAAAVPSGCSLLTFDCSSTFLATRLEEAPSTIWVWSLETSQLRTVIMLHANVSGAVWHPVVPHALLITCDGDKHRGMGVVWNPLRGAPQVADFSKYYPLTPSESQLPPGALPIGKHRPTWLNLDGLPPSLFYSDGNEFSLAALDEGSHHKCKVTDSVPWPEADPPLAPSFLTGRQWAVEERVREESPLELVPAGVGIEGDSELEDTFHYKREE